ncbi:hypothetical protein Trco_001175 [Trichoderma cornu-damae]|uniref:C-8 sterol isomerase n=1 Tax=Trichoderma cornu-damae TaxID=654480 RepID=A0A9P8QTE2_9HYPO|nr:hypothetical protein Trco_001175 [Trichoderma cornu-damae]
MPQNNEPSSPGISRLLAILGLLTALLASVVYVLEQDMDRFYVFDTDRLHDLAKRGVAEHGNDTRGIVKYIVNELNEKMPGYVNLDEEWVFSNAGGAMGAMYILHARTAIGTEGHTGRHTADDYFHILSGTQVAYVPGEYEPEVYPPGSVHHLRRGDAKQYKMPDGCFALEYARGWIPPMLFFGFADSLTSTLDFPTLWRTTYITGQQMVGNLLKGKL